MTDLRAAAKRLVNLDENGADLGTVAAIARAYLDLLASNERLRKALNGPALLLLEMASVTDAENEKLRARVAELEGKLAKGTP